MVRPLIADCGTTHVVDHLQRRARDEVVGPVEPAAQDDRLAIGSALPRRGAGGRGVAAAARAVVAQLLGQRVHQRPAGVAVGLRGGYRRDGDGLRLRGGLPDRRDDQHGDDRGDGDDERRDQQRPRRSVAVGRRSSGDSRRQL